MVNYYLFSVTQPKWQKSKCSLNPTSFDKLLMCQTFSLHSSHFNKYTPFCQIGCSVSSFHSLIVSGSQKLLHVPIFEYQYYSQVKYVFIKFKVLFFVMYQNISFFILNGEVEYLDLQQFQMVPQNQITNKKPSPFSIVQDPIRKTPIYDLHRAINKQTGEVWFAKVFPINKLQENNLEDTLDFNCHVLSDMKEKDHILHTEQIVQKKNMIIFFHEAYEAEDRLINRVGDGMEGFEVEEVLKDIFQALMEIYQDDYFHRNLRPEHIVCIQGVWKIQAFVYDHQKRPIKSQYCWSDEFVSPEERKMKGELPEELLDEQLVWSVGIIGLYMLLGKGFNYRSIKKDSDIDWRMISEKTSPELFQVLQKSLKVQFKQRIRIREFIGLDLFSEFSLMGINLPFLSQSKFFNPTPIKMTQSATLPPQFKSAFEVLKKDIARFKFFIEVEKYVQDLPYRNTYDPTIVKFLAIKISFQNLKQIKKSLLELLRGKELIKNLEVKKIMSELDSSISRAEQEMQSYKNFLKTSKDAQKCKILSPYIRKQILKEEIEYNTIKSAFSSASGVIYTELRGDCEKKLNESKERTICFYSMAMYLMHLNDEEDLKPIPGGVQEVAAWIATVHIDQAVELTQNLIKKHFAIDQK